MPTQTPNLHIPYPGPDDTVDVPRDMAAMANAIDPVAAMAVPAGCIMMWPGVVEPAGWKIMKAGVTVPAAANPGLAAIYGQSGGNVTIPDMTDYYPIGAGTVPLGQTAGKNSVQLDNVNYLPAHSHPGSTVGNNLQNHSHDVAGNIVIADIAGGLFLTGAGDRQVGAQPTGTGVEKALHNHSVTIAAQGSATAHENRPLSRALNYIIKLG